METLPSAATAVPLHLTVDPWWDLVTAIAFGRVDDGLPAEQRLVLAEDERIMFVLDAPDAGPVIGFTVVAPHDVDVLALEAEELWAGPRFSVPMLGLPDATVGEILLAVQARFAEDEPTADALLDHLALAGGEDERTQSIDDVIGHFRLALEAGDMKALFGLGYSLVEAGRAREGYDALRRYTELTPHNAWAWCWLGRAWAAIGDTQEERMAFERGLRCDAMSRSRRMPRSCFAG